MKTFALGFVLFLACVNLGALDAGGLQKTIDQAPEGGTVRLANGEYQGPLRINKFLHLIAEPGATLVHPAGGTDPTLWISADRVTVEGLTIVGTGDGTRRDHTAVYVTGRRVVLSHLTIAQAWSGVWFDHTEASSLVDLSFDGLSDFPFWERGEGVRITASQNVKLERLRLSAVLDGVYVEHSEAISLDDVRASDGRYGLHLMFARNGGTTKLQTRQMVAGLMVMETSDWVVDHSFLTEGYRVGSAGVREVRTKGITITDTLISRQAKGVELLDVREGSFRSNRLTENGVAWTWGGDNSGTSVSDNDHQGNLIDVSGTAVKERDLVESGSHNHGNTAVNPPTVATSSLATPPQFARNFWDAWHGLDLNGDGIGDTPYLFDPQVAEWTSRHSWVGFFLGSPWSIVSGSLPGGAVLDPMPRVRPAVKEPKISLGSEVWNGKNFLH